jgi:hypothetical protein
VNFKLQALLSVSFLLLLMTSVRGQSDSSSPNFQMKFLRARFTDKEHKKDIGAFFQLIPNNLDEFPPMFEPELTYSIDGGPERTITVKDTETRVSLNVFGNDLSEKDTSVYNFVKSQIIENNTDYLILGFNIVNVSKKGFERMTFTYGFLEKNNSSKRRVQKFEFSLE